MIEGKLPRHMTRSALASNVSISEVFLGVRTCELFLFFAPFVFLRSIVLILCLLCFTSLVSLTGSYTEDEPISVLNGNRLILGLQSSGTLEACPSTTENQKGQEITSLESLDVTILRKIC